MKELIITILLGLNSVLVLANTGDPFDAHLDGHYDLEFNVQDQKFQGELFLRGEGERALSLTAFNKIEGEISLSSYEGPLLNLTPIKGRAICSLWASFCRLNINFLYGVNHDGPILHFQFHFKDEKYFEIMKLGRPMELEGVVLDHDRQVGKVRATYQ